MYNNGVAQTGFHHVAMRVADFDRSVAFYGHALGLPAVREWKGAEGRAVLLEVGKGAYLELFERGERDAPNGLPGNRQAILHFAIRTSNCDAAVEAARRAGAEVTMEPKDIDIPSNPILPARIAFFKGPDGETVELFQER